MNSLKVSLHRVGQAVLEFIHREDKPELISHMKLEPDPEGNGHSILTLRIFAPLTQDSRLRS